MIAANCWIRGHFLPSSDCGAERKRCGWRAAEPPPEQASSRVEIPTQRGVRQKRERPPGQRPDAPQVRQVGGRSRFCLTPCHWRGRHRSAAQVCRAVDRALVQSLAWRLVVGGRRRPGAVSGCNPVGKGAKTSLWFLGPLLGPPLAPRSHDLLGRRSPRHSTLAGAPASVSLLAIPAQAANVRRGPGAPKAPRNAREALDAGARSWHVFGAQLHDDSATEMLSDEPQIDVDADINSTPISAVISRISRGTSSTCLA
jgi:hypothetical protein